ncbi:hypothetical protein HFN_1474 [Helicobacter fennelliae MRY12-0050]|uniref:Uncharacterized protein n=1 Tax=Helicobacter fennelliae MRY12-0050 TaxID=1325130 RepID=T1CVV8_9HELI|nr:hypothetical protein HFN_1474 [Helicobacter fennelliae MRY12-0050]
MITNLKDSRFLFSSESKSSLFADCFVWLVLCYLTTHAKCDSFGFILCQSFQNYKNKLKIENFLRPFVLA